MVLFRFLPVASLLVGISALTFQIRVLYPWHNELKNEFLDMRHIKSNTTLELKKSALEKIHQIGSIEKKLDLLLVERI